MAKNFAVLRAQMSPESQARTEAKAQAMLAEMPLNPSLTPQIISLLRSSAYSGKNCSVALHS